MQYTFREIEKKWQRIWTETKAYQISNDTSKPKCYVLDMFPYPSGAGLHVGHPLGYIASDIYARYKRLKGYNVLHPMGFDSFGLPAEQYAIETGQHPAVTTEKNITRYKEQLNNIGFCFDWSREVKTSDPSYYRWTQWIFLQLYNSWYNPETNKAEPISKLKEKLIADGVDASDTQLMKYRLAYRAESYVNWCEALGTVLANDEVVNGVSERGGHPVERKLMSQWFLRITAFAERLLEGLNRVEFPESLKEMQKNWIGKSEGAVIQMKDANSDNKVELFTTRPDTIFGVSFIVLAPEHSLVKSFTTETQLNEIEEYQKYVSSRSERDRMAETKKVTGAFTGGYVLHPFTGKKIPVWIADYVLMGYGTGAIMAVPCGDSRDYAFARHFNIEIPEIFEGKDITESAYEEKDIFYCNSDVLNGLNYKDASAKILNEIELKNIGQRKINYRMRDAGFSRQRYWGEPFPIVYNEDGNTIALDENELPLELPYLETYSAGPNGKGPLANAKEWMNVKLGEDELSDSLNLSDLTPLPLAKEGNMGAMENVNLTPNPSPKGEGENAIKPQKVYTTDSERWLHLKSFARENRKNSTKAEAILWDALRNRKLGYKASRQHAIQDYIADFYFAEHALVIEIDGDYHLKNEQSTYDESRTKILNELGYNVLRFSNEEVETNLTQVLSQISDSLRDSAPLSSRRGAGGEVLELESNVASFIRETDTMPGYAGSSWYYLRYMDPHNQDEFCNQKISDYWNQVDVYVGGAEHAVGHLLYSRMWCKALYDLGFVSFDEPYKKLINQGMIQGSSRFVYRVAGSSQFVSANLKDEYETNEIHVDVSLCDGVYLDVERFKQWRPEYNHAEFVLEDGKYVCGVVTEKMSKSKYNVVNPDDIIEQFGTDTFRMYEMFLGPVEVSKPWDTKGIEGVHRFLRKLWRLFMDENTGCIVVDEKASNEEHKVLHQTIKKIAYDTENFAFNTSVSQFMICVNELARLNCTKREILEPLLITLTPFAPHISEELWHALGNNSSILDAQFPEVNETYLVENSFRYPVAVGGKTRTEYEFALDADQKTIEEIILKDEIVLKWMEGKDLKKFIYIKGRMINVVV